MVFAVNARRRGHPRAQYRNGVILVCVGLLLFPIISASDDLHSAYVLGDNPSWRHEKRSLGAQAFSVVIPLSLSGLLARGTNTLAEISVIISAAQPGHLRLDDGRAPPLAS